MPNLVKIGKTHRNPDERAEELSRATGVATPFDVVYYECFEDCDKTEKLIHQLLQDKGLRLSNNREFFEYNQKFNIKKIIDLVGKLDGKIEEDELLEYNNNDDEDDIADLDSYVDSLIDEAYNYTNGENGCLIDYDRAEELLLKAISIGNSERAYERLIDFYLVKLNDTVKAVSICRTGIDKGHKYLYFKLSWLFVKSYSHTQKDVALQNAKISLENYLKEEIRDTEKKDFNRLEDLMLILDDINNNYKSKISELYSTYYGTFKITLLEMLMEFINDNFLHPRKLFYNFHVSKVFIKLSFIVDNDQFYKKIRTIDELKSKKYFVPILTKNKDKLLEIKDNEKLLNFIIDIITNEEEIERYKKKSEKKKMMEKHQGLNISNSKEKIKKYISKPEVKKENNKNVKIKDVEDTRIRDIEDTLEHKIAKFLVYVVLSLCFLVGLMLFFLRFIPIVITLKELI